MSDSEQSSPKDRRRERTRQEILRAAAEVFAEKGFHDATIQDIARVAEFSTGSIYNYFDNKDTLFFDLLEDVFESFVGSLQPIDEGKPFDARLREQIANLFSFAEAHKNHFQLFVVLTWSLPGSLGREAEERTKERKKLMGLHLFQMIAGAIERDELPAQDPEPATILVVGTMIGFAMRWFHGMGPERLTDSVDTVARLVLGGLSATAGD